MKDQWYGDKRDLVKWGVVLHIAREYGVARILQVAYLRPSGWASLEINGTSQPIPEVVISHFRRVQNIKGLSARPRIEVLDCHFSGRSAYMAEVSAAVRGAPCETSLVLLDPDTGLAPKNPTLEHVLDAEVAQIWHAMRPRDVLVLYQHETNRAGRVWVEPKRQQFEAALGLPSGCAMLAWGPKVAPDVAFFYCVKEGPVSTKHVRATTGLNVLVVSGFYHKGDTGRRCEDCGSLWTVEFGDDGEPRVRRNGEEASAAVLDCSGNNVAVQCCQASGGRRELRGRPRPARKGSSALTRPVYAGVRTR